MRTVKKEKRALCYPYAIFDLDGTLLDSMPYWKDLGSRYLQKNGFRPPADLGRVLAALTMEEGAEYLRREFGIRQTAPQIIEDIYGLIRREYEEEIPAKPGAKEFLRKLQQTGVKMCVATASQAGMAWPALRRLGMAEYISFILDCETCKSGKSSPEIFDRAAARLGGGRENTLVFEDAYYAARTARAAGYYVVGVRDASQNDEARMREACHCWIETYGEAEIRWEDEK